VVPALENVTLWHERDISHSSVERVIAPDATIALDFALGRLAGMMQRLVVHPDRMLANLESLGGVVHSGEVLLALTRGGILREDAYRIVQRCAMATWEKLGTADGRSFRANLLADPKWRDGFRRPIWTAAMDPALHLEAVDRIFARVFGQRDGIALPLESSGGDRLVTCGGSNSPGSLRGRHQADPCRCRHRHFMRRTLPVRVTMPGSSHIRVAAVKYS